MQIFVGNASLYRFEFHYRFKGTDKRRTQVIEPMSQIRLVDTDFQPEDLDYLIEQHGPYGFASIDEVKSGHTKKARTVLMYSVDKPISDMMITQLFNVNKGIIDASGRRLREEAAISANSSLAHAMQVQNQQGLDGEVTGVEMTIQEEEGPKGYGEAPIAEGYRVVEDGKEPRPRNKRSRN